MYFNNTTILYHNGAFEKAAEANTNLYSQSLHYGYGVFEGIRAYKNANRVSIFKGKEHFDRLKNSCELINIPYDFDNDELLSISYNVLELNNFKDAYIRPLVYCDPSMSLSRPTKVNIMICAWEWGAYLGDKLLDLCISSYCRPHPKSTKIEAKVCGNYVNSILATTEAKDQGFDEALLLDSDGFLAEGPGANLFFEKNGQLFTPQRGNIMPGITRSTIIEIAKAHNIVVTEGLFKPEDLFAADSAFYCGTAAEIIGINSIDMKVFPIKWDNSIGKKIQKHYQNLVTNTPQFA